MNCRARIATAIATALVGAAVSACGTATRAVSGHEHSGALVAPRLDEVTPIDDPRTWEGPSTAVIGTDPVDPITDATPKLPATVTDAQGTRVTVTDTSRILALDVYGTLARTVYELGLGDSVVGRDISTQFAPADSLPMVTQNGHDLNAEAILALAPSVIITDTSLGPWDVVLQMRDAGIPVVVVDSHRGVDNIGDLTLQVADALGLHRAGVALAERSEAEVRAVEDQIATIAPAADVDKLRTIFLYARGHSGVYYLFGEGSGADSLIGSLGAHDVAAEIGWEGMKPVTDEGIVAAQPDLIVMMTGGLDSVDGVDGLLERLPALANTPAGQHQRIVDMADSQVLGFGTETAAVLNALAVAIYAPQVLS